MCDIAQCTDCDEFLVDDQIEYGDDELPYCQGCFEDACVTAFADAIHHSGDIKVKQ